MTCGIYKLTSPSGKCYIGQSINIERRYIEHKRYKKYKHIALYNAIKKYNYNNFKFETIEICSPEELNDREIYWINFYDSFKNGYNCTTGGYTSFKRSEDTKEKLSKIFTGVYNGDQNIEFYIDDILYNSIGMASKKLNIPAKTIHNRLNSKNIKYDNYRYKDINLIPIRHKRKFPSKICNINGKIYESATIASKELNIKLSTTLCYRLRNKKYETYFYIKPPLEL